jgi:hypothetical protein
LTTAPARSRRSFNQVKAQVFHHQLTHAEREQAIDSRGKHGYCAENPKPGHAQQPGSKNALYDSQTHGNRIAAEQVPGIADDPAHQPVLLPGLPEVRKKLHGVRTWLAHSLS